MPLAYKCNLVVAKGYPEPHPSPLSHAGEKSLHSSMAQSWGRSNGMFQCHEMSLCFISPAYQWCRRCLVINHTPQMSVMGSTLRFPWATKVYEPQKTLELLHSSWEFHLPDQFNLICGGFFFFRRPGIMTWPRYENFCLTHWSFSFDALKPAFPRILQTIMEAFSQFFSVRAETMMSSAYCRMQTEDSKSIFFFLVFFHRSGEDGWWFSIPFLVFAPPIL